MSCEKFLGTWVFYDGFACGGYASLTIARKIFGYIALFKNLQKITKK